MDDERMPLGLRGASVRSAQSSGGTQQGSLNGLSRDRRRSSSYGRVGQSPLQPIPASANLSPSGSQSALHRPHSHACPAAPGNSFMPSAVIYVHQMYPCPDGGHAWQQVHSLMLAQSTEKVRDQHRRMPGRITEWTRRF